MNSLSVAKEAHASKRSDAPAGDKSCCWSVTINNPTDDDKLQWASLTSLHWVREVSGQIEMGKEGTPHIQGMIKTTSVRHAQVKKSLPRAHVEAAKSPAALAKYVVKQDTRVAPLPTTKTATQAHLQELVLQVVLKELGGQDVHSSEEMMDFITAKTWDIKRHWERYLDQAVTVLLFQGYYGIEFVVSNPQIRTAFRKYLPGILYRTYNARSTQEHQVTAHEAQVTDEAEVQSVTETQD